MKENNLPPLILLAGGLATRLHPITHTIAKSMIDINGKPFIDHQLRLIKNKGITSVIICVGFLSQQIIDYVENGSRYGLEIKYSNDGDELLGTGGSVKKAIKLLNKEEFIVMYGDSYLDVDLKAIWQFYLHSKKSSLMTIIKNENKWDSSNVEFENDRIIDYDKTIINPAMKYIDYGISIFDKKIFSNVQESKFDLSIIHQKLIKNSDLAGYEVFKRFYEIGSSQGIKELQQLLS